MPRVKETLEERFWAKVEFIPFHECWIWTATTDSSGYGRFKVNGRLTGAHQFSYRIHNGTISDGLKVMHSCDTPACVRPEHLSLGTHADNMADMAAKGRARNWCTDVTHCKHGHEFTEENTYRYGNQRLCRTCRSRRMKEYYARRAERLPNSG